MALLECVTQRFAAMGCQIEVHLNLKAGSLSAELLRIAEQSFQQAEARFSRFLPNSELSQLNAVPEQWVTVSADFWQVLRASLEAARLTHGLFDPTLASVLEATGYHSSFEMLDVEQRRPTAWMGGRWQEIALDNELQAVKLPLGVRLDFGGIVKGIIAQQVVQHLDQYAPCMISAGGDVVAGRPPIGFPGWPVGIAGPSQRGQRSTERLARLWVCRCALMTSGVDFRRWQTDAGERHHIIDPALGDSAETDLLTATVLAPQAWAAEAWATAALVAGLESAYQLLTTNSVAALLVTRARELHITPLLDKRLQFESIVHH